MYKGDTLYRCSCERMKEKLKAFSDGDRETVRKAFAKRMKELGAEVSYDDLGNAYATIAGSDADGKRIVISCPDPSDTAGICAAVEAAESVIAEEIPHNHSLTVLLWNDESTHNAPELVPAMGIICRDYLPEEVKHDYKDTEIKPAKSGGKKHRLNTHDYRLMFEVRYSPAVTEGIGTADIITAGGKLKRAPVSCSEKLTGLVTDCAAVCKVKCETVHCAAARDNGTAAYMLPAAVILTGAQDPEGLVQAADVLLTALLQADKT